MEMRRYDQRNYPIYSGHLEVGKVYVCSIQGWNDLKKEAERRDYIAENILLEYNQGYLVKIFKK